MKKCSVLTALLLVIAACTVNQETSTSEVTITVREASSASVVSLAAGSSAEVNSPSTTMAKMATMGTVLDEVAAPSTELATDNIDCRRSEIL